MKNKFNTQRLSARAPVNGDAPRITELMQDKELPWMLARAPWPYTLTDAESWVEHAASVRTGGTEYPFSLHHAAHGLIGSVGMSHAQDDIWEIGYWIGKPYWGQGFVTEAARGLLEWAARTHGVTRFISGHIVDNAASGHVLLKLGFSVAGEHTMYVKGRNCEVNAVRYVYGGAPAEVALMVPDYSPQADS